jgi:ABC-type polysaccharide transport system permease subunit
MFTVRKAIDTSEKFVYQDGGWGSKQFTQLFTIDTFFLTLENTVNVLCLFMLASIIPLCRCLHALTRTPA